MEQLACAILIQTLKDFENLKKQLEILDFVQTAWFEEIVSIAGLDPDNVRQQFISKSYCVDELRKARAEYR